jgi:hypothetical protein
MCKRGRAPQYQRRDKTSISLCSHSIFSHSLSFRPNGAAHESAGLIGICGN